jgi:hypothetical protein
MNLLEWFKLGVQLAAAVAWPLTCLILVWCFRTELRGVLHRLRKLHGLGLDLETDEAERLGTETRIIQEEQYPERPVFPSAHLSETIGGDKATPTTPAGPDVSSDIWLLKQADEAPAATALMVRQLVEIELRKLLAATGHLSHIGGQVKQVLFPEMLKEAEQSRFLSLELISSMKKFRSFANAVIHGQSTGNVGTEIVGAGLNIVNSLRSIPHQRNFVHLPNVPIYSDAQCTIRAKGHGIILEAVLPPNEMKVHYIYPTMRNHFQKGKEVAWEWNTENKWGETWYRDESGQIKSAWSGSAEFVGRHLEDV